MQKYFDFYGESQRSEYWAVNIIGFLVIVIGYAIAIGLIAFGDIGMFLGAVLCITIFVGHVWLFIATSMRRCRDAGINTWWTAAVFIPYIGIVPWIVIGVLKTKE